MENDLVQETEEVPGEDEILENQAIQERIDEPPLPAEVKEMLYERPE